MLGKTAISCTAAKSISTSWGHIVILAVVWNMHSEQTRWSQSILHAILISIHALYILGQSADLADSS